ncbi:Putative zinc ribbon domain protein [Rubripirellula lacrimiformis]|uniref:Zinc ribbon domain protein n=1 Tax=Rubripirellula lacrimiformis TaxID=1930273 RepID=A0A517NDR4_9BACT|nr:phospholipase [Rubripirellula lacrimiformis]QDT05262.1 Putative zinc ribbon domain protein [Rubripirellula lacrimiformis]
MSSASKIEISTELLRTLHRIHRQLTDLHSRIDRGPRQIKAGETLVAKATADVESARQAIKAAKVTSDEKQLQLATREARMKELQAKLNTAASNREFNTLKDQIAADEQANLVQSDEIFEALEQIDVLEKALAEAEAELKKQQSEHTVRVKEVESKQVILKDDLAGVEQQLAAYEAKIPAAVLGDYKRITSAKGEDALAPVDENSCGGCYQTLTTQHIETLRMSVLMRCPNCNAFLYFPENLSP